MAHNNTEIEIKINLDTSAFIRVREKVKYLAIFVKKIQQVDTYFTPVHRDFIRPAFPFEWLSIRKRGNDTLLNYKHWYPEDVEDTTHCDEFEVTVDSEVQLEKIFSALNIRKLVTVEKEREVYQYQDKFEISFDTVKELGYFIEIESLKDFDGVEATREKLFDFANQLGIDISNVDKRGYPYILMKKKGFIT